MTKGKREKKKNILITEPIHNKLIIIQSERNILLDLIYVLWATHYLSQCNTERLKLLVVSKNHPDEDYILILPWLKFLPLL